MADTSPRKLVSPDGGPAFPVTGEGVGNPLYHVEGLTKRDYFAAAALPGVVSREGWAGPGSIAKWCYEIASAMLRASEQGVKP